MRVDRFDRREWYFSLVVRCRPITVRLGPTVQVAQQSSRSIRISLVSRVFHRAAQPLAVAVLPPDAERRFIAHKRRLGETRLKFCRDPFKYAQYRSGRIAREWRHRGLVVKALKPSPGRIE